MENSILTLLIFLPVLGAILMLPASKYIKVPHIIKYIALGTTGIQILLAAWLYMNFDPTTSVMDSPFTVQVEWIKHFNIEYFVGVDGLSIPMVLLTALLSFICILASWNIEKKVLGYFSLFLLLDAGMMGVFLSLDFFLFYIFWEFTLVPMYFLIGIWGGENRIYASIKFFLYTMAGSILMLVAVLWIGTVQGTFSYTALVSMGNIPLGTQRWLFLAFAAAFAIKVPMWPLHSWLPDAHVEAPTAGSVILAGVLLKLGTYGFLRFNLGLFPDASHYFAPSIAFLAVVGIIYGAIVSYPQKDVKKLVAYSSVSHLGFVMLGLFALNDLGIQGAILQMVNHGISTGALFLIVGMIYERRHTRSLDEFGGLWTVMPLYGSLTLIVVLSSMGLPGLNGFVGEFTILLGAFGSQALGSYYYSIFAALGVILAAIYMLWMFQKMFLGAVSNEKNTLLQDLNWREIVVLVPLLILIFWIGLYPSPFFNLMSASVEQLTAALDFGTALVLQ